MKRSKFFEWFVGIILAALAGLLSGCSSGIAVEKLNTEYFPPTRMPDTWVTVVYDANLVLAVWDPDDAAGEAAQVAYENGGYLESARSWFDGGDKYITVVLVVPASGFDIVYNQISNLGKVITEQIKGDAQSFRGPDGEMRFSHITLDLRPRTFALEHPSINLHKWRPVRTFQSAFQVFTAVFGFFMDAVIWLLVLAGPFAVLWWGGRWMLRQYRQKAVLKQDEE